MVSKVHNTSATATRMYTVRYAINDSAPPALTAPEARLVARCVFTIPPPSVPVPNSLLLKAGVQGAAGALLLHQPPPHRPQRLSLVGRLPHHIKAGQ